MLDQIAKDLTKRRGRTGPDRDLGVARVDPPGANPALADLERPAHLQDPVEDLGQEERVDDVPPDLHLFDHSGV